MSVANSIQELGFFSFEFFFARVFFFSLQFAGDPMHVAASSRDKEADKMWNKIKLLQHSI